MPINVGIDVLIVGGGMYVSGKGTTSDGTIMPALLEARRHGLVNRLGLVTTTADSANENKKRVHSSNMLLKVYRVRPSFKEFLKSLTASNTSLIRFSISCCFDFGRS